jgi:hypothetical protein
MAKKTKKRSRKKKATAMESICWYCSLARGDKCFSVPREKRWWVKKRRIRGTASKYGMVTECVKFTS